MEIFCGWISYMAEEMELAPATINIRVRTMITLFNIHNHVDMIELLHENNIVNDLEYCKVLFEGTKLSFELLEDGYGVEEMEGRESKCLWLLP